VSRAALVDPGVLGVWLDDLGLPGSGPPEVERITTGHSNEVFAVTRGGAQWVLRRPPRTPLSPTAHDMARESRLITALAAAGAPVPLPHVVAFDADRLGVPAYLMERLHGVVVREAMPDAFVGDADAPRAISDALIDLLVGIHAVDWQAAGLADFGRPEGYLERQVPRWIGQLDRYRTRPLPEVDEAAAWLAAHTPPMQAPTIIHGDYKPDNVMFEAGQPVRPLAVLDWEQATIGDPLVDLGWMLGLWLDPGESSVFAGANAALLPHGPVPTRADLADRYAAASGRDLEHLGFHCVLGLFKLACVMEGSYARFAAGTSDDPLFEFLADGVPALARRALSFAG
jgi:aminoglycoside phosphotransferase (APT) family kinase protein